MLGNMLQYWMVKEKGRREWASLISPAEGGTLPILENKVIKLYYWGMFHFLNKITVCVLSRFSCVWLFATLWKVAHQTPLSMEFSRQEHWSGLPCPPPGGFPNPGIEICFLRLLHCRWILYCWATREAKKTPLGMIQTLEKRKRSLQFSSVQFSHSVMSESLWTHGLQHTRPPCPSPPLRVYSNPCPLSQWCHPTISSSVIPFLSHLHSFPASGSFQMSLLLTWGGQSIGVSASASVLPMNTQDWSPLGWTGWISLQSKGLPRVFSNTTVQKHQFFSAKLSL